MSLLRTIDQLQATLDRLRAEASFSADRTAYQSGADYIADQVELLIARRLELLDGWMPQLAADARKHELVQLREAIRRIALPNRQ